MAKQNLGGHELLVWTATHYAPGEPVCIGADAYGSLGVELYIKDGAIVGVVVSSDDEIKAKVGYLPVEIYDEG